MVRPGQKREAVRAMMEKGLPRARACALTHLSRAASYSEPDRAGDTESQQIVRTMAMRYQRLGYRMLHAIHRNDGGTMNHKKFYRIYREMGLGLRRRRRKKIIRERVPMEKPDRAGVSWSMDFVFDRTEDGRVLKILTLVDDFSRESLWLEVDRGIGGGDLVEILEFVCTVYGVPVCIRTDNGAEFTSHVLCLWMMRKGIRHDFIQPGRPVQNAYIESFNGRFRDECLNGNFFLDLEDARTKIETWRTFYNEVRPHSSLGMHPPGKLLANL